MVQWRKTEKPTDIQTGGNGRMPEMIVAKIKKKKRRETHRTINTWTFVISCSAGKEQKNF